MEQAREKTAQIYCLNVCLLYRQSMFLGDEGVFFQEEKRSTTEETFGN
jgi:hypothetical protein